MFDPTQCESVSMAQAKAQEEQNPVKAFKTYYDKYDVIEADGDRVVIGIGKTVTAAVNAANLKKA